jgi:hypothetical protein
MLPPSEVSCRRLVRHGEMERRVTVWTARG